MIQIAVTDQAQDKQFTQQQILLSDLDVNVKQILVPISQKIKRKHQKMLTQAIKDDVCVIAQHPMLQPYEKGKCSLPLMYYFPINALQFITHGASCTQIALQAYEPSAYIMDFILKMGQHYKTVTLYVPDISLFAEMAETIYSACGLPLRIKKMGECDCTERYVVRLKQAFTIEDTQQNTVYRDVHVQFLYPLAAHVHLPLHRILKIVFRHNPDFDIFSTRKVKLVDNMSK